MLSPDEPARGSDLSSTPLSQEEKDRVLREFKKVLDAGELQLGPNANSTTKPEPSAESEMSLEPLSPEERERVLRGVAMSLQVDRVHLRPPLQNGHSPLAPATENRSSK